MSRKLFAFAALFVCFSISAAAAEEEKKTEIFGGYSLVHQPDGGRSGGSYCYPGEPPQDCIGSSTSINLSGFEASAGYRVRGPFSLVADFGGLYGSSAGTKTRFHTFLAGPQFRFGGRVSPYLHLFLGAARQATAASTGTAQSSYGPADYAFATALGGGFDIKLSKRFFLRPINVDYLLTRFSSATQNQARISVGLVVRF